MNRFTKTVARWTTAWMLLALPVCAALATDFDYRLQPQKVAEGVYVLTGLPQDFSNSNGGNIVNTGFIVGPQGVVVIDSGPSRRYGEQLRAAIARVTALPVVLVINTHHHPDHFLGNQAFDSRTLAALPSTRAGIEQEGESFNANMYRLVGDWMRDTEIAPPTVELGPGRLEVAGRSLELFALDGHTGADLAVLDLATGTLFAGDLVFHDRSPTTPHAHIPRWLSALDVLEALPFKVLVPGHGPVAHDAAPLRQTRDYLRWLDDLLRRSAAAGMDMAEVLKLPLPGVFARLAVAKEEYARSVGHLYPAIEQQALEHRGDDR